MTDWLTSLLDFLINRPLIMLALMAFPFLLARYLKKCFPTRRMLTWAMIPTAMSLAIIVVPDIAPLVIAIDSGLLGVAAFDLLTVVAARHFSVQRTMIHIGSLDKIHECELAVSNLSRRSCRVRLKDDLPTEFAATPEFFDYRFGPRSRASFQYEFKNKARGRFDLNCVFVTVESWLGLWRSYDQVPAHTQLNVYPDMKQISQYQLLARTNRLNLMGVRRTRRIGQDNEFERLRDYTQDDNHRHIDWRTTARRRKLTVRDFQSNQSQRIIFMLDCGRMMTGESDGISMLDHALNAMLMLSYVALKQGDAAGLICFSDAIHNYTPPRSGVNHINRLLHASFDLRPRFVESRYDEAFMYLRTHCLKRSLVVLVTNVIDEINSHQIHQYMGSLVTRHLPLGVLLRDHQMFGAIEDYEDHPETFFEAAAAAKIVNWRQQVISDLQHRGVLALDVYPEKLTSQLVNQYLEIKAKHLL